MTGCALASARLEIKLDLAGADAGAWTAGDLS